MGTATLNVWVTEIGDPCKVDLKHPWYIHILHCDGSFLTWCLDGRDNVPFTNLETHCGHREIEVPPGEYLVMATWSPSADDPHQLGNHLTHLQVVRVNCADHACVTLFPPTAHFCGTWFQIALNTLIQLGDLDRDVGGRAIEAIEQALRTLRQPPDPLTEATARLAPGRRTAD
jgi:hypothetical protein